MAYIVKNHKLHRVANGSLVEEIANFDFDIVSDTQYVRDDGSAEHVYQIRAITESGEKLPIANIKAGDYGMGRWTDIYGAKVSVENPALFKHVLRGKGRSKKIKHTTKYQFTGFVTSDERTPYFVDNNGKITANGYDSSVRSELTHKLAHFALPAPTKDADVLNTAVQAVLDLKALTPNNTYLGILAKAIAVRAVIALFLPNTLSLFLLGQTGSRKSAIVAVLQSFFGPAFFSQTELPADWNSTYPALENMAIIVKTLLVIDEFTPRKGINDKALAEKAEMLLRSVANGQSKQRANSNGSYDSKRAPGALILSTGESLDINVADSLLKRVVFCQIERADIDLDALTECQALAEDGVYAQFTASFIQAVLQNFRSLKTEIPKIFKQYRDQARGEIGTSLHPRCHENIASLMIALHLFYAFAKSKGVITNHQRKVLLNDDWEELKALMFEQESIAQNKKPAFVLEHAMYAGLSSGRVHFLDYKTGGVPKSQNPEIMGWKNGKPNGRFIGWFNSKNSEVYIPSDLKLSNLIELVPEESQSLFPTSEKSFWKAIHKTGGIKALNSNRNTINRTDPDTKEKVIVYNFNLSFNTKK